MTFTPVAFRPVLNTDGTLQCKADGRLVHVPPGSTPPSNRGTNVTQKIAEVVTALASASLIFVPNSRLNVYPHSCAFALVLLGFSVLYTVGFMAMLAYFYEDFLYRPTSYSPTRYGSS